jgi:hypothetical protein
MLWLLVVLLAVGLLGAFADAQLGLPRGTVAGWGAGLVLGATLLIVLVGLFRQRQQAQSRSRQAADSSGTVMVPEPPLDPIACQTLDDLTGNDRP